MNPDEDARETDLTPLEQARRTAALCQEKLASDVTILDMRGVCDVTDVVVIATGRNARQDEGSHSRRRRHSTASAHTPAGRNARQTKAIYDEVAGTLKTEQKLLPRSTAGVREADRIGADRLPRRAHPLPPLAAG